MGVCHHNDQCGHRMCLRANICRVFAMLLALTVFSLASEASAHGNHDHAQYGGTHRMISTATGRHDARALADLRSMHQGRCGGATCCGNVCVSCCSLIAPEITVDRPPHSTMRLEVASSLSQTGLGPELFRRPPKV